MLTDMKVEVIRITRSEGPGNVKAFADVNFADMVVVKGLRVVDGAKGIFVSFPRKAGKDGKWYETVSPTSPEWRKLIAEMVLDQYKLLD